MEKNNARCKKERKIEMIDELLKLLKIVKDRQDAKAKGEKSMVRILNSLFNNYHRDKDNYYNSQYKEIEENNREKMRARYQKIQDIKGKFKSRLGMLNDPQGSTLSDQEKMKRRRKQYTKKLS